MWWRVYGYFFAMWIWGFAALKIYLFLEWQSLGAGGIDTKAAFILLTYVIVALIHVTCTGYALFGIFAPAILILTLRR